jgi:type IV secretory pathway VirB2 component (pilin)
MSTKGNMKHKVKAVASLLGPLFLLAIAVFAQDPLVTVSDKMATSFVGPIARAFTLLGVVVTGIGMWLGRSATDNEWIQRAIMGGGFTMLATGLVGWYFT